MDLATHAAAVVGIAVFAYGLARFPRALFVEAGGGVAVAPRLEWGIAGVLGLIGLAAFEAGLGVDPASRLIASAVLMVFAAIVQADLRFLVIPDVYSALIAAAALVGPVALDWKEAAFGAVVCGGLLAAIAWIWKRRTAVEGLGFGDVKLAAAIGALLGPEKGLWAITLSAAGGAMLGFVLQALRRSKDGPLLFPYGAPLALAGAGFLIWRLL